MPLTFLIHDRPKDMRPVRARLHRNPRDVRRIAELEAALRIWRDEYAPLHTDARGVVFVAVPIHQIAALLGEPKR